MSDPLPPEPTPNPAPKIPDPLTPPPAAAGPVPPTPAPASSWSAPSGAEPTPPPAPAAPGTALPTAGQPMGSTPPPPTPPTTPLPAPSAPTSLPAATTDSSEQQWAVGLHLSALLALLGCGIPALNVLGPLVIWLLKRPTSPRLDAVGKRVLNFQISYAIYAVASMFGFFVLGPILIGLIFGPVLLVIGIAWLVLTIMGAVKESNGEAFRFPLTIEFFK